MLDFLLFFFFLVTRQNDFLLIIQGENRPFAASHSRGTKPPRWRAKVALLQDKQNTETILNGNFLCLSCPSATFALQHGGFVPRKWLAAKGLFGPIHGSKIMRLLNRAASKRKKYAKNKQHHVIQVLLSC